eukprot:gnl/TRDRNA2_/TRDRNA2_174086_c0_seq1.p2 gnl/TRDRNA2_/TRDRNA2_174086_c0~~gnl/TRDRNA2_/TRDRNA2_174086_c0_seq1.p2  ORF type:complete len:173 (+),score=27.38 gnl/TRDRNA2_/TRDRNA2_174086_c0_seq1:378-896(+)
MFARFGGQVASVALGRTGVAGRWRMVSEADVTQQYFTSSGHFAGAGAVKWEECSSAAAATTQSPLMEGRPMSGPYDAVAQEKTGCVTFTSLDALLATEGAVDIVRLAVIGNEADILDGARQTLARRAIRHVSVECLDLQCDAQGVQDIATSYGYCATPSRHDSRWHFLLSPC